MRPPRTSAGRWFQVKLLPGFRARRRLIVYILLAMGYIALMWFLVFPWLDRTFVDNPTLRSVTLSVAGEAPRAGSAASHWERVHARELQR